MSRSFGNLVVRAALAILGSLGCTAKQPPPRPTLLEVDVPSNLAPVVPVPVRNPLTREGVALGRRLFFDVRLSRDNDIACATCHRPELGFSDGKVRSRGHRGQALLRHTPALQNLAWAEGTFWDGGAKNLESQVFGPLTSPEEMDQDVGELVRELEADPETAAMFDAAFSDGITMPNLVRAIAQFERTIIGGHSRYDRFVRGEAGGELSSQERQGMALVKENCSPCHATDFFTDFAYHNNGLDESFSDEHERLAWGRARITDDPRDRGRFKTPTLRNVARTAPYMHDGRFADLGQVLRHYRSGIKRSPTLDPRLVASDGRTGIPLDNAEARAIIAFLHALTEDMPPDDEGVSVAVVSP